MARLDGGRFARWLEKFFNLKSAFSVVNDVSSSIQAVLVVHNGVEDRYLQGWDTFQSSTTAAAVAAQFSRFQIRNPAGSGVVVVIEHLSFASSVFLNINAGPIRGATIDLGNVQTGLITELDVRGRTASSAIISADTNASGSPGAQFAPVVWGVPVNTPFQTIVTVNQEIPVLPGTAYFCVAQTVNIGVTTNIRWRERALEQSELT